MLDSQILSVYLQFIPRLILHRVLAFSGDASMAGERGINLSGGQRQ